MADCEAAFSEAGPQQPTVQELATRFTETVLRASAKHIPRGARANSKPWALDPELQAAIAERREAYHQLDPNDPPSRQRWVAAKQQAAEVEKKASQQHFRNFVETTLNKPASVGKVSKILKAWERSGDDHWAGQALREEGRLLASDSDKGEAFQPHLRPSLTAGAGGQATPCGEEEDLRAPPPKVPGVRRTALRRLLGVLPGGAGGPHSSPGRKEGSWPGRRHQ